MPNPLLLRTCPLIPAPPSGGEQGLKPFSSASFLKLAEDRGHMGFWSADLATNSIAASVGMYRIFGLHPMSTLTYDQFLAMMHPEDRPAHEKIMELLQSGQPIEREFRIIRPDRTMRWVLHKTEVILGPNGVPARTVGVVFDVTAQREAQRAVELEQARYRVLVEAVSAVVWTSNPSESQPVESQSWCKLTGQTEAELNGRGWLEAVHPEDRAKAWDAWQTAVSRGTVYSVAFRVRHADGTYHWIESRAAPILRPDGVVREWIGLCLDVANDRSASCDRLDASSNDKEPGLLTGGQVRAARGMLNWSVEDLAHAAGISVSTVRRFESGSADGKIRQDNLESMRAALKRAGVECTFYEGKPGIQFDQSA